MLYYIAKNGTHGVDDTQRSPAVGYNGAFDVIKLTPGARYDHDSPSENFIGNRGDLPAAIEWADRCAAQSGRPAHSAVARERVREALATYKALLNDELGEADTSAEREDTLASLTQVDSAARVLWFERGF